MTNTKARLPLARKGRRVHYWTGFRAIIEGESFIIRKFIGDYMEIELPNGKIATISRYLPEAISS